MAFASCHVAVTDRPGPQQDETKHHRVTTTSMADGTAMIAGRGPGLAKLSPYSRAGKDPV